MRGLWIPRPLLSIGLTTCEAADNGDKILTKDSIRDSNRGKWQRKEIGALDTLVTTVQDQKGHRGRAVPMLRFVKFLPV